MTDPIIIDALDHDWGDPERAPSLVVNLAAAALKREDGDAPAKNYEWTLSARVMEEFVKDIGEHNSTLPAEELPLGISHLLGMKVEVDPDMDPGVVLFKQGDRELGRIININVGQFDEEKP